MKPSLNTSIPITLANPRGFCAGVDRAIEIVNQALAQLGQPVFVHHEVVHNKTVVDDLRQKGAVFVQNLDEVPNGENLIFSAHGVSLAVRAKAKEKNLTVFDATCPLVTKVHLQVTKFAKQDFDVILIGHAGHPEVDGTLGQFTKKNRRRIYLVENTDDANCIEIPSTDRLAFVTQTTLSLSDTKDIINILQTRFPHIQSPKKEDICYATQNRQNAIIDLSKTTDLILVVGSPNSSNSNRLTELARQLGVASYLIDSANEIKPEWLAKATSVGISSGASAPERLVDQVVGYLESQFNMHTITTKVRADEKVKFPLPAGLK